MSLVEKTIELKMIIPLLLLSLVVSDATQPVQASHNATQNWTTCDEFAEGNTFDPASILDIDWKVFYIWSLHYDEPYSVRFREPSPELIDKFKSEIHMTNSSIDENWNDTVLFMESTIDLSALFIKTSTPGKFKVLTTLIFDYNPIEELIFILKVVEPGYLGLMNCKFGVVVALAPQDKFPKNHQLEDAASVFKVRHPHGYAYNVHDVMLNYDPLLDEDTHKAFEEDQIEVEMSSGILD